MTGLTQIRLRKAPTWIRSAAKALYAAVATDGLYKIGVSADPDIRKLTLECDRDIGVSILAAAAGMSDLEIPIHHILARYRALPGKREWYFDKPAVRAVIEFISVPTLAKCDEIIGRKKVSDEARSAILQVRHLIDLSTVVAVVEKSTFGKGRHAPVASVPGISAREFFGRFLDQTGALEAAITKCAIQTGIARSQLANHVRYKVPVGRKTSQKLADWNKEIDYVKTLVNK